MCVELTVLRGQVVCLYWKWASGALLSHRG